MAQQNEAMMMMAAARSTTPTGRRPKPQPADSGNPKEKKRGREQHPDGGAEDPVNGAPGLPTAEDNEADREMDA